MSASLYYRLDEIVTRQLFPLVLGDGVAHFNAIGLARKKSQSPAVHIRAIAAHKLEAVGGQERA